MDFVKIDFAHVAGEEQRGKNADHRCTFLLSKIHYKSSCITTHLVDSSSFNQECSDKIMSQIFALGR